MRNKAQKIAIAFIIGAFCRYIYFMVHGFFSSLIVDYGIIQSIIGYFPKYLGTTIFLIEGLIEIIISAFITIFIPVILFGYSSIDSKKWLWFYSVCFVLGIIGLDLFFYSLIIKDYDLLLNNYLPLWYGVVVVAIWIGLFYWLLYFGQYFKRKKTREK